MAYCAQGPFLVIPDSCLRRGRLDPGSLGHVELRKIGRIVLAFEHHLAVRDVGKGIVELRAEKAGVDGPKIPRAQPDTSHRRLTEGKVPNSL
ncbi:MAG: hypothetical protein E2O61_08750 [Gammaproteobacteria bacterium]|nr:MAG: hypothetical protein E2O61_08750 [Gammaproteobacteria bacterium]